MYTLHEQIRNTPQTLCKVILLKYKTSIFDRKIGMQTNCTCILIKNGRTVQLISMLNPFKLESSSFS